VHHSVKQAGAQHWSPRINIYPYVHSLQRLLLIVIKFLELTWPANKMRNGRYEWTKQPQAYLLKRNIRTFLVVSCKYKFMSFFWIISYEACIFSSVSKYYDSSWECKMKQEPKPSWKTKCKDLASNDQPLKHNIKCLRLFESKDLHWMQYLHLLESIWPTLDAHAISLSLKGKEWDWFLWLHLFS
jgi:hypothetical protein